ncbi:putative methyltransferase-like protein 24 [Glandiceps talaboti]
MLITRIVRGQKNTERKTATVPRSFDVREIPGSYEEPEGNDHPESIEYLEQLFNVLDKEQVSGALMSYLLTPTYECKGDLRMGDAPPKDGGWNICTDVGLKSTSCIVYSVGIGDNWSFDDDMAAYGCNVYSFDPSIELTDHQRSERIWFYNMGLWDQNEEERQYNKIANGNKRVMQTWKCRTLESIKKMLHHENDTLDVVKIDIEGQEYRVFPQMLESGVMKNIRQLVFEIHLSPELDKIRLWKTYVDIKKMMTMYGFELWSIHPNEVVKKLDFGKYAGMHPCCYELSWINTNFLNKA